MRALLRLDLPYSLVEHGWVLGNFTAGAEAGAADMAGQRSVNSLISIRYGMGPAVGGGVIGKGCPITPTV